jgi:squalene-associated FAD-dependent desaturase
LSASRRVVVIGGGLAGITAALDCADAGARVTLVEVRRRLGGAAYSFEREGLMMDNGQHVFLRCCVAYRALLARLGSEDRVRIQPRLEIPVLKPGAPTAALRRSSLPAPLHLSGTLVRYPHLSVRERMRAARAALALARLDPSEQALDEVTFGDWLSDQGQSANAVHNLWDLIALPALNLPAADASLALAAFVFRTGLFSGSDRGDIGFHRGTLDEVIGEPAARALSRAGVKVMLGWRAERLELLDGGFEVHGPQASLSAEVAILAVPPARAATLIEPLIGASAQGLRALESSPIVNLHVLYDRPVCPLPFAAGVRTPVQYLFDRTASAGAPTGSQYLVVSLSGAEREMQMSVEALREEYVPALARLLPAACDAQVELFVATREHAATFRAGPGVRALRPCPRTSLRGLVLAGAWTATDWPATLEGAVMSGHAAARAALQELALEPPRPARAASAARATSAAEPVRRARTVSRP